MKPLISALFALIAGQVSAEALFASRTIPARTIIQSEDVVARDVVVPGGMSDLVEVVGMEARVALYAGRAVLASDVVFPAVVERNDIVQLLYVSGALRVSATGRALDRASPGDVIRVMNLSSRTTVSARIGADGSARVEH